MSNIAYAFLLSSMAGLSTLLGFLPILFRVKKKENIIIFALSFAAGVMICVSITDLIPEAKKLLDTIFYPVPSFLFLAIFFCIGLLFSMFIDSSFPKKETGKTSHLYHVGLVSMMAIVMHNIPEGIATFLSTSENRSLGLALTLAISLHNIPEGISISIPVYYGTGSKKKAFLFTLLSGISEPIGAVLAYLFLSPFINDFIMSLLFSFIAGIMIHISIYELLKESISYQKKYLTIVAFCIGFLVMFLSHYLL